MLNIYYTFWDTKFLDEVPKLFPGAILPLIRLYKLKKYQLSFNRLKINSKKLTGLNQKQNRLKN